MIYKTIIDSTRLNSELAKAEKAIEISEYKKSFEICNNILSKHPEHLPALRLIVYASIQMDDDQQAIKNLNKILKINPNDIQSQLSIAKLYLKNNNPEKALSHILVIDDTKKYDIEVLLTKAECHRLLDQIDMALKLYNHIIEKYPKVPDAYYKLATILESKKQSQMALELIDIGIKLMPNEFGLMHFKAMLLRIMNMHGAALKIFNELELSPGYDIPMEVDHADTLRKLRKFSLATQKYNSVIIKSKNHKEALLGLAATLYESNQFIDALNVLLKIHDLHPSNVEVLIYIAGTYRTTRDFIKANYYYNLAYKLNPYAQILAGNYLYTMNHLCDWEVYFDVRKIIDQDKDFKLSEPFPSIALDNNPQANFEYAKLKITRDYRSGNILPPLEKYQRHEKIRIGYYSSDFHIHATTMLIEGLLRAHNREQFEIHAFSLNPTPNDIKNQQLKSLFNYYHDVSSLSDSAVTLLSRSHQIDIAIDLKGFTMGCRTGIFVERAAPVQINFLGYPGTMGATFMDYIIADKYIINQDNRDYFSEKVIYMPNCYQPNTPQRPKPIHDNELQNKQHSTSFIYCSFNNLYKLTPEMFNIWLTILRNTPDSVLWLLRSTEASEKNIIDFVKKTDINPSRIIFCPILPEAEHLQRLSHADCFLDSFPCNAHTTASDAVWAGVPIITKSGRTFASRVAGSILKSLNLQELIADNDEDYIRIATKIYNDKSYLRDLKIRVKKEIKDGCLYNAAYYAKNFESALKLIYEFDQSGIKPHDIYLASS